MKHISSVSHDILILGKSPIKWTKHPDMTIAVDWDVKHLFKQNSNKYFIRFNLDDTVIRYNFESVILDIGDNSKQNQREIFLPMAPWSVLYA